MFAWIDPEIIYRAYCLNKSHRHAPYAVLLDLIIESGKLTVCCDANTLDAFMDELSKCDEAFRDQRKLEIWLYEMQQEGRLSTDLRDPDVVISERDEHGCAVINSKRWDVKRAYSFLANITDEGDEQSYAIELSQKIVEYFNMEELRTICFQLKVNHEKIPYHDRDLETFAREVVIHFRKMIRLDELRRRCAEVRPNIRGW